MDEGETPSAVVHGEASDADSGVETDPKPGRRTSVELAAWEWRLVCCALQHASTALHEKDVDARIVGDRLHALERRIDAQLRDDGRDHSR
jgi:hypothetical protein